MPLLKPVADESFLLLARCLKLRSSRVAIATSASKCAAEYSAISLDDHHGDGRVALNCKSADGANETLARVAPDRFFIPKYVGARGWLGLWLDLPKTDWEQVEDVITEAYCLVAPRSLWMKVKKPTLVRRN